MSMILMDDTIAAISTPVGKSGIGIVRLSGKDAISIAEKVFLSSNAKPLSQVSSHSLHYGWIVNNSEKIDEVLLTVMRAPKTYTREDIVEINCHSGLVVLRKILQLLLNMGARLAQAGEFTKRAYLSGRIDLAQAEAVLDVVNSLTPCALSQALGQLQGRLSQKITTLRKNLLHILTHLELSIDFSDQDIPPQSYEKLLARIIKVAQVVENLLGSADRGMVLRQGLACVICGRTNVGKSSLLNALLKKERAIVTPIPGTTRDALEETIDLEGIPVRLIDTAGMSKPKNLVEKEAVKRSHQHIKEADLILLVLDASQRLTSADLSILRPILNKPALVVLNKQDLPAKIGQKEVAKIFPGRKVVAVSALRGRGLDKLEREIVGYVWEGKSDFNTDILVSNIRHREALKKALKALKRAIKAVKAGQTQEIIAVEIKAAQSSLGEIIGQIGCEDILESIFSQFCIGK